MSPAQQLKHWQQILETLPQTVPQANTATTEERNTNETELTLTKRKPISSTVPPEEWSKMSKHEKRHFNYQANKRIKETNAKKGKEVGGCVALDAPPPK
jgi:hypothetical protein